MRPHRSFAPPALVAALAAALTAALAPGCHLVTGLADLHVTDTTSTGGSTSSTGGSTSSTGGTGGSTSTGGATSSTGGTGGSPSPCSDGEKNGTETDTDCGGLDCAPCDAGATCAAPTDCKSEHCAGTCIAAARIAAGNAHACAVTTTGDVFCWGANSRGQLGRGATSPSELPDLVNLHGVSDVAAGGVPEDKDVAHTCVLTTDGGVHCWGANTRGQLGDGSTADLLSPPGFPVLSGASALTAGGEITCALDADGAPFCWGGDTHGEIGGDGEGNDSAEPLAVKDAGKDLSGATAIAAGVHHVCAAFPDEVACWGANNRGQLASSNIVPASKLLHLPASAGVTRVAAGYDFTCSQDASGVSCWGDNHDGQLTDGAAGDLSSAPLDLGFTGALGLALGSDGDTDGNDAAGGHACVITSTGAVSCWGNNRHGQLGRGIPSDKEPVPAEVPALTGVLQLATGAEFTCALLDTGAIRCWGRNDRGQLGTAPSPGAQSTPVPVSWP